MPELPEVEIAARNLRAWTRGRRIERVEADPKARYVFRPSSPAAFARALDGARFAEIRRIGKHLLVALARDGAPVGLLAHLGMTGKWLRRSDADPPTRFSRARFHLDDGAVLHFDDLRLFGRLRVVPGARFEDVPEVAALGPDPLERGIDAGRLGEALARSRLPVKVRIMDQAILPGVGNIQASEALFRARIDPRRPSKALSAREVEALAGAVLASVRDAIAELEVTSAFACRAQGQPDEAAPERVGGSGGREDPLAKRKGDRVSPRGDTEPGSENPFAIYGREGERCPRCRRAKIARAVQAQRSTFFCPRCQR